MDTYEAWHDSSLKANATMSFGNPYDLMAFYQLTGEIFVAASVKYVEANGDMKKVFNWDMKQSSHTEFCGLPP